jgi:hypothetical protein
MKLRERTQMVWLFDVHVFGVEGERREGVEKKKKETSGGVWWRTGGVYFVFFGSFYFFLGLFADVCCVLSYARFIFPSCALCVVGFSFRFFWLYCALYPRFTCSLTLFSCLCLWRSGLRSRWAFGVEVCLSVCLSVCPV